MNTEQLKSLFKMPSRQDQLWALILLSAATMIVPYGIQGALSSGKAPASVSDTIWLLDNIAWAIRAMVEGLVIAYIARTKTDDTKQAIWLWVAEGALVALITLTLGPTLYAALNGVAMKEALPWYLQWAWALGLASYMPLMVLGASYAYKVQPGEVEASQQIDPIEQEEYRQLMEAYDAMEAQVQAVAAWELLTPTDQARMIAELAKKKPASSALAAALNVNPSTVSKAYKSVNGQGKE